MLPHDDLSHSLNLKHVHWAQAAEAGNWQQAAFLANDLVALAQQVRRLSFINLDEQKESSP